MEDLLELVIKYQYTNKIPTYDKVFGEITTTNNSVSMEAL